MYQLGQSGRDAASGEQGLIDPVDEAEGTDRLLGQATKMLRSYLKENVPLETFAGANARWVQRHLWRTCNVIAVARPMRPAEPRRWSCCVHAAYPTATRARSNAFTGWPALLRLTATEQSYRAVGFGIGCTSPALLRYPSEHFR